MIKVKFISVIHYNFIEVGLNVLQISRAELRNMQILKFSTVAELSGLFPLTGTRGMFLLPAQMYNALDKGTETVLILALVNRLIEEQLINLDK